MKKLVILSLVFLIGAAAIAEDKSAKGASCCSHESQLQAKVDQLTKKVEALEAAANKSAEHGHDDLEDRVAKLEKSINGTGGSDGSGIESRVTKLETSVNKLEVTVRQI